MVIKKELCPFASIAYTNTVQLTALLLDMNCVFLTIVRVGDNVISVKLVSETLLKVDFYCLFCNCEQRMK